MSKSRLDITPILSKAPAFGKVFDPRYEWDWEIGFFDGGRASGKSFVPGATYGIYRMVEDWYRYGYIHNILETRQVGGRLSSSNYKMYKGIIQEVLKCGELFRFIDGIGKIIFLPSGGVIDCVGLYDNASEIKSMTGYTMAHIEEANNMKGDKTLTISNLAGTIFRESPFNAGKPPRPHKLIITFNPLPNSQWLYDEFKIPMVTQAGQKGLPSLRKDVLRIHTTYRDNLSMTEKGIQTLYSSVPERLRPTYIDGIMSSFEEAIFTNWRVEELSTDRNDYPFITGAVDFSRGGADPTVCLVIAIDNDNKKVYILEEKSAVGLSAIEQIDLVENTFAPWKPILVYLDHDSDKKLDIRRRGVECQNAYKRDKNEWALDMQDYEIIVNNTVELDEGFVQEIQNWMYMRNRDTQKITDVIPDGNDHRMDAFRYGTVKHIKKRGGLFVNTGGYQWQ